MAAFRRKSSFATVVRFFNMIGYTFKKKLRARTNYIKEFYTVAKLFLLLNAANNANMHSLLFYKYNTTYQRYDIWVIHFIP